MAIKYLDFEGGNDANDGTTFANRWKTITSGATSARIAAGDTIRIMGSPDPTLVGSATWTQYSKTITLAGAVTANISDCETLWTASANVTTSTSASSFKENTKAMNVAIAAAFTTGKAAFFATGALDLSAYQQVSFWAQTNAAITAGQLSLRLCTDTAGATPVHTIAIPAIPSTGQFVPVTVDLGGAMNAAIQSIALYRDAGTAAVTLILDNIIACKASSSPDSLTLTSLIGKVWNLNWAASTAYALNDIRKPTSPNRNGYRYKCTVAGTSGSTEPTWPQEINGAAFTDGSVTWQCEGLEDTWYGIQSINGTTVKLDTHTNCAGNAGRGYAGSTETVATYKRETIKPAMAASFASLNAFQQSGTQAAPILFTGGWNRTDMSTQTGETWTDPQHGNAYAYNAANRSYLTLENLNSVRAYTGIETDGTSGVVIKNCHHNNATNYGLDFGNGGSQARNSLIGVVGNNCSAYGFSNNKFAELVRAATFNNNLSAGIGNITGTAGVLLGVDIIVKNNASYGVMTNSAANIVPKYYGLISANNGSNGVYSAGSGALLFNSSITDATPFGGFPAWTDTYFWSQKHGQVADAHLGTTDGGTIISATDQRYTATGISWKFRPTSALRGAMYPLKLSVTKIRCAANTPISLTIPTRRDNANIKGQLVVQGGQIAGVPADVAVDCQPTINTWTVSSTLTFTPTEDGVVEVLFKCWDGVGTTNNFWISARDLTVS